MVPDPQASPLERVQSRDREQPGGEAGLGGIEAGAIPRHGDPGLLAKVLGGLGVGGAEQPADQMKAGAVVAVVETREGVRIAGAVGAQQLGVLLGVVFHPGQA